MYIHRTKLTQVSFLPCIEYQLSKTATKFAVISHNMVGNPEKDADNLLKTLKSSLLFQNVHFLAFFSSILLCATSFKTLTLKEIEKMIDVMKTNLRLSISPPDFFGRVGGGMRGRKVVFVTKNLKIDLL